MTRELGTIRDPLELVHILRARADELNISREEIDALAGLTPGYSSKILCVPPMKGIGPISLFPMLGALGIALVLIEDEKRMKRIAAVPKRRRPRRFEQHWRNAKALGMMLEMAAKYGSNGGRHRFEMMTPRQLKRHQSKAAKAMWRARRLERKKRQATAKRAVCRASQGSKAASRSSTARGNGRRQSAATAAR